MTRFWGCLVLFGLVAIAGVRGQDAAPFTQQLSQEEYHAAGLDKLSPAERAKLDDLFAKYRGGALAQAKAAEERAQAAEAAAAEAARSAQAAQVAADTAKKEAAAADARAAAAAKAPPSSAGPSFLSKARALILPGTRIEYATIQAHIVGNIRGWGPSTVFLLDNGQRWQVADRSSYYDTQVASNPAVTIGPAKLAGFEMHIAAMGYLRVRLLSGPTYTQEK